MRRRRRHPDRGRVPARPSLLVLPLVLALLPALAPGLDASGAAERTPSPATPDIEAVVLPRPILASMNDRFRENNEHWDEAPARKGTARFRMPGNGRPTQLEYLGCLEGGVAADTLRIRGWRRARDLVQFQFGVDGDCGHVADLVGTWHTHPFRVEKVGGEPVKERTLSPADLDTFREGPDLVVVAVWDVDSLDAAVRGPDGGVVHPVPVVVR